MVNILLIPKAEEISELRKLFFDKLNNEGAPSTCIGEFLSFFFGFIVALRVIVDYIGCWEGSSMHEGSILGYKNSQVWFQAVETVILTRAAILS